MVIERMGSATSATSFQWRKRAIQLIEAFFWGGLSWRRFSLLPQHRQEKSGRIISKYDIAYKMKKRYLVLTLATLPFLDLQNNPLKFSRKQFVSVGKERW
jgi:hypothetical protein